MCGWHYSLSKGNSVWFLFFPKLDLFLANSYAFLPCEFWNQSKPLSNVYTHFLHQWISVEQECLGKDKFRL